MAKSASRLGALRSDGGLSVRAMTLAVCCLAALFDGADSQAIGIAGPLIASELGLNIGSLGLVFSTGVLGAALGAVTSGSLVSRLGLRPVLAACVLCFGVFSAATPLADGLAPLLFIRFLAGLGLGGATPCFLALAAEQVPDRLRMRTMGLVWACFPAGGVLGGLLNGWLIEAYSWRQIFFVGGALPIVLAVCVLALPRTAAADARPVAKAAGRSTALTALGQFGWTNILALWTIFFIAFGLLSGLVAWAPTFLAQAGVSPKHGALVLSSHSLGALVSMASAGYLLERFGPRLIAFGFLAGTAAIALMSFFLSSAIVTALVMALLGVFLGLAGSGGIALVGTLFGSRSRSVALGWSMGWGRFGQVIFPLLMGYAAGAGVTPSRVIGLCSFAPVLAAIAALSLGAIWRISVHRDQLRHES